MAPASFGEGAFDERVDVMPEAEQQDRFEGLECLGDDCFGRAGEGEAVDALFSFILVDDFGHECAGQPGADYAHIGIGVGEEGIFATSVTKNLGIGSGDVDGGFFIKKELSSVGIAPEKESPPGQSRTDVLYFSERLAVSESGTRRFMCRFLSGGDLLARAYSQLPALLLISVTEPTLRPSYFCILRILSFRLANCCLLRSPK